MMPPRLLIPRQTGLVQLSSQRARAWTRVLHYSTTTRLIRATSRAPGP